jgi:hypothetical protein
MGLYDIFGTVDVRYVPGNHVGYVVHLIYDRMKWRYQNFETVNIHTHSKYIHSFKEGMTQFLLYHGKHPNQKGRAVAAKDGPKRKSGIQELFLAHKDDYYSSKNHVMLQGDLHAGKYQDQGSYEEYIIPSLSPPDQYAEGLGLFQRPGTYGFVVHDENGIEIPRRYYFDRDRQIF